jgi:hypothetical protein
MNDLHDCGCLADLERDLNSLQHSIAQHSMAQHSITVVRQGWLILRGISQACSAAQHSTTIVSHRAAAAAAVATFIITAVVA